MVFQKILFFKNTDDFHKFLKNVKKIAKNQFEKNNKKLIIVIILW